MPPLSKFYIPKLSAVSLALSALMSQGLEIESDRGFRGDTQSGKVTVLGPLSVQHEGWEITSAGNLDAFFDRVLKKKNSEYQIKPKLRSAVISHPVTFQRGASPKVKAPNLIWLSDREVLRSVGEGILIQNGDVIHRSTAKTSELIVKIDGTFALHGSWQKAE